MKYIKPEMEIINLEIEVIVTASIGDENTPVDNVDGSDPF